MTSLSAHFVQSDDHDRLTFHPACPRCRSERLEGRLNDDLGVPLRAQAAITAGVLAFSAVAPSAAFATDGDVEGTAPPGQVAPDMDSEGELDAADEATSPPTDVVPDAAGAPVEEQAPEVAPEPEVVDSTDPEAEAEAEQPVAEEPEPPDSEPAPATPVPGAAPTSEPAAPATATSTSREASRAHARTKRIVTREVRRARQKARAASSRTKQTPPTPAAPAPPTPAPAAAAATEPATAPAPRAEPVAAVAASTVQQRDTAKPGDRTHTVQRGESLWSIAADVLGDDASPARIAREVNRLWELNKSRIGTGDRNLVHAGTKLRLA